MPRKASVARPGASRPPSKQQQQQQGQKPPAGKQQGRLSRPSSSNAHPPSSSMTSGLPSGLGGFASPSAGKRKRAAVPDTPDQQWVAQMRMSALELQE